MVDTRGPTADPLPGLDIPAPRIGRHERRVAIACRSRRRAGALTGDDDALVVLAVGLARQLDRCEAAHLPYAYAQLAGRLVEVEAALSARAGGTGTDFDRFLESLSAEGPHPAQ